ncbi:MAG TPA: hypothetical protein IAB31_04080 [Candidatus Choladousia intestinavium]|uniref:Uncharacterized protein n=1 Tax=Candidatus Choladousia intestinavium TaxID=2840727 RepID=A0A9D1ABA9_9FIRM|nr:hypothetical protein [Candidatus Choladousia intestinavium]
MDKKGTEEDLWQLIAGHAGETFYTKKGLPFTYEIRGGEMFVDRREKSITRSTFEKAFQKIQLGGISGPKALGMYGAPYIWGVLTGLSLTPEASASSESCRG